MAIANSPLGTSPANAIALPHHPRLAQVASRALSFAAASGIWIGKLQDGAISVCAVAGIGAKIGDRLPSDAGLASICIESGRIVRCDDLDNDHRVGASIYRAAGARSALMVPVLSSGEVQGMLAALSPLASGFTRSHIAVLLTLADVVAEIFSAEIAPANAAPDAHFETSGLDGRYDQTNPSATVAFHSLRTSEWQDMAEEDVNLKPATTAPAPAASAEVQIKRLPSRENSEYKDNRSIDLPHLDSPGSRAVPPYTRLQNDAPAISATATQLPTGLSIPDSGAKNPQAGSSARTGSPLHGSALPNPGLSNINFELQAASAGAPAFATATPGRTAAHSRTWQDRFGRRIFAALLSTTIAASILEIWAVNVDKRSVPQPQINWPAPRPPLLASSDASAIEVVQVEAEIPASPRTSSGPNEGKEDALTAPGLDTDYNADNLGPVRQPAPVPVTNVESPPIAPPKAPKIESQMVLAMPDLERPNIETPQPAWDVVAVPASLVYKVLPAYPPAALKLRSQGTVEMTISISDEGQVTDARVITGLNVFRQPALAAVRQWHYRPARIGDKRVPSTAGVILRFTDSN